MSASHPLEAIYHCARRIASHVHYVRPRPSHQRISLTLPDPSPIVDHLLRNGASLAAAQRLSDVYMQEARKLKLVHEHSMNKAINASLEFTESTDTRSRISSLYSIHMKAYRSAITQIMEYTEQRISTYSAKLSSNEDILRPDCSVKHAAPILEKAFISNPYPTRPQKEMIAYHAAISYRQVDVWFQNRRSRSKREGKEMRKFAFIINDVEDSSPAFDGNIEPQRTISTPSSPVIPSTVNDSLPSASPPSCPFQVESPPHAFPNAFPPMCDYNPFPLWDQSRLFTTPWLRHAATGLRENQAGDVRVDIEQLCSPLSRLTLADDESPPSSALFQTPGRSRRLHDRVTACFPYLICPPTAPLPALVSATVTVHSTDCMQIPSSSSPLLSRHIVNMSTPSTTSVRRASTRKFADVLPLRAPHSLPKLARHSAHPYQSRKASRPEIQQARSPRLSSMSFSSSIASNDSCSSRASSASLESPPPITPPQLSVELPRSRKESSPDLVFSPSQDLDDLFSDSDAPALSFLNNRQPQIVQ